MAQQTARLYCYDCEAPRLCVRDVQPFWLTLLLIIGSFGLYLPWAMWRTASPAPYCCPICGAINGRFSALDCSRFTKVFVAVLIISTALLFGHYQ